MILMDNVLRLLKIAADALLVKVFISVIQVCMHIHFITHGTRAQMSVPSEVPNIADIFVITVTP